jgi:alginate O-acetyltransferase complex protein AlgI
MRFNSPIFWAYLLITVTVLWSLPPRFRKWFLLLASYVFYGSWHWPYLALLLGCVTFTYYGARWIDQATGPKRNARGRWILAGNVLLLFLFKYLDWSIENFNALAALTGQIEPLPLPKWLLPLGVSFYVFEAISYTIDVTKKRETPQSFLDLQLFVAFFPHLIAGPIMRAKEFIPQLYKNWEFRASQFQEGVWMVVSGLFTKIVLADGLAVQVDNAFSYRVSGMTFWDVVAMSLGFAIQIYLDFSSYTRIGLGAAQMCGLQLVQNFNYPFNARNPVDLWNRWHMSLSRWVRDYLYYPLVGGKLTLGRMCRAALISMTICGLWHGASWKYVLWGAYHGSLICGYQLYRFKIKRGSDDDEEAPSALQDWFQACWSILLLQSFLLPCALIFRSNDVGHAMQLVREGLTHWSPMHRSLPGTYYLHVASLFLLIVSMPTVERIYNRLAAAGTKTFGLQSEFWPSVLQGCVTGVLFAACLVYFHGKTTFIYFQF